MTFVLTHNVPNTPTTARCYSNMAISPFSFEAPTMCGAYHVLTARRIKRDERLEVRTIRRRGEIRMVIKLQCVPFRLNISKG